MLGKMRAFIKKHREIIVYLAIGALTTLVNFLVYLPLIWLVKLPASASNAIAWVVVILFAYVTNKIFVFQSKRWSLKVVGPEFLKFVGCRVASGVFETLFIGLTIDLPGLGDRQWYGLIMKVIASIGVVILNYVGSKLLVFRKKESKE